MTVWPPAEGEVIVWVRQTADDGEPQAAEAEAFLSPDERSRWERLKSSEDRRDYAAAHVLLRQALSQCGPVSPADWTFVRRGAAKPALDATQAGTPALDFSLTHTRGVVACAVARGVAVGVDVERVKPVPEARRIAATRFAPDEARMLEQCAPSEWDARFVELWTLKEAYAKAIGLGLRLPLDTAQFSLEGDDGLSCVVRSDDATQWRFWLAAVEPNARLSVAVRAAGRKAPPYVLRLVGRPFTPRQMLGVT